MTQQIINTGAVANDGTGESLRNAFNAVNENFTQIWASGPVDSQVVITNNRISTDQTNLDLVLAGNGIGNVAVASTIVPTINSVYDLGSPTRYFDSTYSQYFYGNGRFLTGINSSSGGGNVTFSMAPPSDPAVGDIWIESDTGVQYLYFNDDTSSQWAEMEAYISFSSANSGGNINLTDIQSNVLPSVSNTYQLGTASQQWKTLYVNGNTVFIANTPVTITSGVMSVNGSNVLTEGTPLTFTNLTVSNNLTVGNSVTIANRATIGNIYSDHYYYANGVPFGQGGGNLGNSVVTAKENVLSVSVLNEDLVLAGNGVGNVAVSSSIVPLVDSVHDLGSTTEYFNSTYSQYFYGNGRFLTGVESTPVNTGNWAFLANTLYNPNGGYINNSDLSHGATAYISIPANGNTLPLSILNYYGNFSVTTANAPGYTKSWTYDYTGNITLPTNTANINYANGVSILNGISGSYGNSNVSVYLASGTDTANIITTGNVTGGNLTTGGIVSATGNVRGANFNTAGIVSATGNITGGNVGTTGNITGNYFIGNGLYGTSTNDTAVLGNASGLIRVLVQDNGVNIQTYDHPNLNYHSWTFNSAGDLYLPDGNVGIYYANGQPYGGSGASTGNIDITGTYVSIAAGADETLITISPNIEGQAYLQIPNDATANVANVRIHNDAGNIELGTGSGSYNWYFDNAGNLSVPVNINFNGGGLQQVVNEDFYVRVSDDESDGWSLYNVVDDGAGNDLTQTRLEYNQFSVRTDIQGNSYTWQFNDSGTLGLPGNIAGNYGGNLFVSIGDQPGSDTFIDLRTISYVGDALISNIRIANPNVTVSTSSGAQNWTFGSTGTITLPNGGNIRSVDELTIINSTTTANGAIGINARESTFGDSVAQVFLDGTDRLARISTYNPDTEIGYDWTFDVGGSLTIPTAPGNIYMGTNTNGPVILPTSLGIELNANRADTTQDYISVSQDGVNIFSVNTINIENNTTGLNNSDININSGDDIFLRGRNKVDDDEAEGGDINIWAGQGSNATSSANDPFGGGDIQIQGGLGGSGTGAGANGSTGGFVSIVAGQGGTSVDSNVGSGGDIEIAAGSAPSAVDTAHGGFGGGVSITAGDTTRINESGGSITLNTGSASGDGTGAAGYVSISIPSSNIGPGGNWYFTGTGRTLEVPADSEIFGPNFGNFTVGCAGNTIVTSSDYGANVKNWTFGYTGTLSLPGMSTGTGTGESGAVQGTRKIVGITNGDPDTNNYGYAATSGGHTAFGNVAWTASSSQVQSGRVTFAVQTNGTAFNWEQFDVAICKLDSANAFVTVSNRIRQNSAIAYTEVSGYVNAGVLEIWLNPADGQTVAFINYDAVEFNLMVD